MASSTGRKENILSSWKEIAAYLDRDVRTCVRWEQRYGLPVHRLGKDSKGKVFAYKDQIDEWLASRTSGTGTFRRRETRSSRRLLLGISVVAVLAAASYVLFIRPSFRSGDGVPADFRIRGSRFVAVNAAGGELWSFETGLADLENEAAYRQRFQEKRVGPDYTPIWPHVVIRDLDGDSRPEVLFSTQTKLEDREGSLVCLDGGGREKWRFRAGRELVFGGRPFRREYRIFGFNVDDYDGDRALEILVLSFHKPDWPCQAVLLDAAGVSEGEYWNAGYLMDGSAGDIDGDGDIELALSGVNNEYARGCLAVFDAGELRGQSPQRDGAFRSPELGEGGQSAYILFPKSEVHVAIHQTGDPVNYFWIHDGDGVTAMTTETQIYFDLDRTFACRDVTLSDYFRNLYEKIASQGGIFPLIDDGWRKKLGSGLLYYQGGSWLGAPASAVSAVARHDK